MLVAHLQAEGKEKMVPVRLLGTAPVCALLSPFSRVPWPCFLPLILEGRSLWNFPTPKRG